MHIPPRSFLAEDSPDNGANTVCYSDHTFHHALKSGEMTISLKSFEGQKGERGLLAAILQRDEIRHYDPIRESLTISRKPTKAKVKSYMTMVKSPPPKAPWHPRKMINCNIVCASAQASEKLPAQAVNT
jgi:hypothetical protein